MSKSASIIFDKSVKGRMGVKLPKPEVPSLELIENISQPLLRQIPAELPEITEPEVVRHFVNLSTKILSPTFL